MPIASPQEKDNELTITSSKNGLLFNNKKIKGVSDISTTIQAHYSKGITSFEKQFDTGVLEYGLGNDSELEKSTKPIRKGMWEE